ncbi:MFS transporter [Pengzhenrongella sp.]|uniref:MFS transporter n=1 Tax=Pengzhenrongella sp. TaxID=2888820 RepID=UPI002F95D373
MTSTPEPTAPTSILPPDRDTAVNQDSAQSTGRSVPARLILMMFLQFFVPGTFTATLGLILITNDLPKIVGAVYALTAIAAILSPMAVGAVGDRLLAAQKVLGLAHIIGGLVMIFIPRAIGAGNGALVLGLIFVYKIFYQPTVGLANTIALRHLGTNRRMFPYVRVFGTLGWVTAGLSVGWLGLSASTSALTLTVVGSFALGLYAFTLPSTPPGAKGAHFTIGDIIGSKAFVLLRDRSFRTFMLCALMTSISLGTYNSYASPFLRALGIDNVAGVLAIGQASEVLFIITIPFLLKRLGMKWVLLTGMTMWGARFVLFALAAQNGNWLAISAIALHGVCSDFFVIVGAMYIDRAVPIDLAAQAQSMLILVIQGIGSSIGAIVAGFIYNAVITTHADATPSDWLPMWILPMIAAVATSFLWATQFREPRDKDGRITVDAETSVGV